MNLGLYNTYLIIFLLEYKCSKLYNTNLKLCYDKIEIKNYVL